MLLLSAGVFVVAAGYNIYLDGSKYHTGFYLLFLLPGIIYLVADSDASKKILKEPVFILAAIFLLTIVISVGYPGTVTQSGSELKKAVSSGYRLHGSRQGHSTLWSRITMISADSVAQWL